MKSYLVKITSETTVIVSAENKEDALVIAYEEAREYDAEWYSEVLKEYDREVTE